MWRRQRRRGETGRLAESGRCPNGDGGSHSEELEFGVRRRDVSSRSEDVLSPETLGHEPCQGPAAWSEAGARC